ncbi:MAG: hypothetical protein AAGM67_17590, partial [Bacteroidota bacterium]
LERDSRKLKEQFQEFRLKLITLEDDLLQRLANAPEDILSDLPLIEGLESTKAAALEIEKAVTANRLTEIQLNAAREIYRPVAVEGSMLYFLLTKMASIDEMYQFSLELFECYFQKSIRIGEACESQLGRVENLKKSLRKTIYLFVCRGLFERHKLLFATLLCFTLLQRLNDIDQAVKNKQLISRFVREQTLSSDCSPIDWLSSDLWRKCQSLEELEFFSGFCDDISEAPSRFLEWFKSSTPEAEKLPMEWSSLEDSPLEKLLVLKSLRADRITDCIDWCLVRLLSGGRELMYHDANLNSLEVLQDSFEDSGPRTPIYFIVSPGSNAIKDLEDLAVKKGFTKGKTFHNVSMGQGQDIAA